VGKNESKCKTQIKGWFLYGEISVVSPFLNFWKDSGYSKLPEKMV